ncbi:tripartite tricarboxylate transporter TctB family protein [Tepidibacillus sp. LV47]|uniref:tripartite tricarboxylate transporter TctB family protein n=1 Tax=Tepidibacillus sp. LV47 TaxID=3398228 RepID=UPI003AAE20B8
MNKSIITSIVAMVIGIVYSVQAYQLPRATVGSNMAPIYFPLGLGVFMFVFGMILFIRTVLKEGWKGKESITKEKGISYTAKLITFTSVVSIIYAFIFDLFGYVLSTIFFMGAILFVVNGKKQWKVNIIVSITFSLGIYIIFSKFLGIILPKIPFIEF